ncbi:hypothetical protein CRG98_041112 [Punica granatum]|uniref:Uncharacterized protein n=1 Tax=Punica granatum TaxID=22663 RepID=A0A2I0I3E4_PUNGR|nr:hypothetical protein CRG98_041112 [Punica granatum]
MGSSPGSPSHSECSLCGRQIWIGRVKLVWISPGNSIGPSDIVGTNRFSCKPLDRSDPTPGSLSPRCLNLFIGRSKYAVYLVPLDPGNLPVLDIRVAKWQVATPSHVRPLRVPEKADTPKPRCLGSVHACPDEIKFGCAQLGDSTGDT